MINNKTVFILGAGASVPYGYPTGYQLRQQIIENLDLNKKIEQIDQPNKLLRKILNEKYRPSIELKDSFLESRRSSIDSFLENRPNFCKIGKLAIAGGIIEFEQSQKGPWDWFEYLHDSELAQCRSAEDYCVNNNVDFITFNYDRHLEHSLINSLKNTFGEKEDICAELINDNFKIIHVHGILDNLPWENKKTGRNYGDKPSSLEELENSSKGIKIIHEKIEKKYFGDAIELLENAELIIFLGLNLYNKINIDRLKIKNNLENKRIYATLKGLTGPQREYVSEYFENKIINLSRKISLQKPEIYKYGSYELLSEKVRFHF